jgi:endonuclease YncB( thermonuclease family)
MALALISAPSLSQAKRIEPLLLQGRAYAIDGDTIQLGEAKLRIHGIDAPELRQTCEETSGTIWACGRRSRSELAAAISGADTHCVSRERDRYQRLVATCWVEGRDLGSTLVAHGWALAYQRYSRDYVGDEDMARRARLGLWAGRFEAPWEWRATRKTR